MFNNRRKNEQAREESFKISSLEAELSRIREQMNAGRDRYTTIPVFDTQSKGYVFKLKPTAQSEEMRFLLHNLKRETELNIYTLEGERQQRAIGIMMGLDMVQEELDRILHTTFEQASDDDEL